MLLNIFVIVFILGMAYWWSTQGFFSGMLHCAVVVVAGALSLAIWEPLAVYWLLERVPRYAWAVGLLGPFVLLLILLRNGMDMLVPQNLSFPPMLDLVGGGVFGVVAALLTAGLFVIGMQSMPTGTSLMGYQPLVVSGDGSVISDSKRGLWVPVDRMTAGFYNRLSNGAFSSGNPISEYIPELSRTSALFRMRTDPNASIVATPDGVSVTGLYVADTPLANLDPGVAQVFGQRAKQPRQKLVLIDTEWVMDQGTFDEDSTLRLAATQVRLATSEPTRDDVELHAPLGVSTQAPGARGREFVAFNSDAAAAYGINQQNTFGFAFIVPVDHDIDYLLTRRLRLAVESEQPITARDAVYIALGQGDQVEDVFAAAEGGDDGPTQVGPRQGTVAGHAGVTFEVTNQLPRPYSRNLGSAMDDENGVLSGTQVIRKASGRISSNNRVDTVYAPSHQRVVRLEIARDAARSLFGTTTAAAASLQPVYLRDSNGQQYYPFGYARDMGGDMELSFVDRTQGFRSARQFPTAEMNPGDRLFLYFAVPVGTTIESYHIGNSTQQQIGATVSE